MAATLDLSTLLKVKRPAPLQPAPQTTPDRELARPNAANASLDTRCEVLRFSDGVRDETGGYGEAWFQAGSYPCRVEATGTGVEGVDAAGDVQSATPYTVYLPKSAQVTGNDRLGIPGWFNVLQVGTTYQKGSRIILEEFDGFFYELMVPSTLGELPLNPFKWRRVGRAQFLEIVSITDAVEGEDLLSALCKEVE